MSRSRGRGRKQVSLQPLVVKGKVSDPVTGSGVPGDPGWHSGGGGRVGTPIAQWGRISPRPPRCGLVLGTPLLRCPAQLSARPKSPDTCVVPPRNHVPATAQAPTLPWIGKALPWPCSRVVATIWDCVALDKKWPCCPWVEDAGSLPLPAALSRGGGPGAWGGTSTDPRNSGSQPHTPRTPPSLPIPQCLGRPGSPRVAQSPAPTTRPPAREEPARPFPCAGQAVTGSRERIHQITP